MLNKITICLLILFFSCFPLVFAQNANTPALEQVNPAKIWPDKASWLGHRATFFRAKMHHNLSYLMLYEDPTAEITGVEQLELSNRLINKPFIIDGLYSLKKKATTEYYWHLVSAAGPGRAWVKDSGHNLMADEPFALAAEIAQETQASQKAALLAGAVVWANRNIISSGDVTGSISHLERLTVVEFHSAGPFSEKYTLLLKKDDGSTVLWHTGMEANTPVYSHQQFCEQYAKSFYQNDPFADHANWSEETRSAIMNRIVRVGMDTEMVQLSWGRPLKITNGKNGLAVWEYDNQRTLYYKDNIVTKIIVPDPKQVAAKVSNVSLVTVQEAALQV